MVATEPATHGTWTIVLGVAATTSTRCGPNQQ